MWSCYCQPRRSDLYVWRELTVWSEYEQQINAITALHDGKAVIHYNISHVNKILVQDGRTVIYYNDFYKLVGE